MKAHEAESLIQFSPSTTTPQVWADLGSGSGTFTLALAEHLPKGSEIIAIDKRSRELANIPASHSGVQISTRKGDFLTTILPEKLQGVLMANALHYVKEKEVFLAGLIKHMGESAQLLMVEYDTTSSNPWVPYPISKDELVRLAKDLNVATIELLG
ncbi:MAG: class I SAM-dependent methyltransferase, partial [Bacteroidota bacterium]